MDLELFWISPSLHLSSATLEVWGGGWCMVSFTYVSHPSSPMFLLWSYSGEEGQRRQKFSYLMAPVQTLHFSFASRTKTEKYLGERRRQVRLWNWRGLDTQQIQLKPSLKPWGKVPNSYNSMLSAFRMRTT